LAGKLYFLLKEIFECGYPQKTDSDILNLIILQGKEKKKVVNNGNFRVFISYINIFIKEQEDIGTIASHITGATNWRPEGLIPSTVEPFTIFLIYVATALLLRN
jgi:hypothetical protein